MRLSFRLFCVLPLTLLVSGCVYALHTSSEPTHVRLRVISPRAEQHAVRVALYESADYPVAEDGRVEFTVPRFSNGCNVYVLGFIKTRDGSAEKVRVIEVRGAENVLRKLSLSQIANLPTDDTGYSVVRIAD